MTQLSKYIASNKTKIIIKNKYELLNTLKDTFHIIIYFKGIHKIEINVRKLNTLNGWNNDIKIKLYNIEENEYQILSIGSCEENNKIIELYTKFKIEEKPLKILEFIPKRIIQTNKKICNNLYHYNAVMTLLEKNPDYEYFYFNDNDAREFIKKHFIENILDKEESKVVDVLKAYDLIVPGAIKADLFRYCYLFIYGGIYIDSKISSFISFNDIINENDTLILTQDDAPNSIYNGIIISQKQDVRILKVIKQAVYHILKNEYLNDIHEPTGNKLLYHYFNTDESLIKLKKNKNNILLKDKLVFNCIYPNYYQDNYNDFRKDYFDKNYYFKNVIYDNTGYIFMFYNYNHHDKFNILNLKENIFVIKRIDNPSGWGMHIKLRVYNPILKNFSEKILEPTKDNEMVFNV